MGHAWPDLKWVQAIVILTQQSPTPLTTLALTSSANCAIFVLAAATLICLKDKNPLTGRTPADFGLGAG
jgi:hypothetical protein